MKEDGFYATFKHKQRIFPASKGAQALPLIRKLTYGLTISCVFIASMVHAGTCYAPDRPFVPADPDTAKEYADLIKRDFKTYINDVQAYFRCLEIERGRAFTEAQEVSQEYGEFVQRDGQ